MSKMFFYDGFSAADLEPRMRYTRTYTNRYSDSGGGYLYIFIVETVDGKKIGKFEMSAWKNPTEEVDELKDYVRCECCSDLVKKDMVSLVDGKNLCTKCVESLTVTCAVCGTRHFRSDTICTADTNRYFCKNHIDGLTTCTICGKYFENQNSLIYNKEYNMNICNECTIDDLNVINYYHTMKDYGDYKFFTDAPRSQKLCMGFELEVSSDNENESSRIPYANHVYALFPDFLKFEEDCSIGSGGFEMISQPATLDHILSRSETFKQAFSYLTSNGYTSHNNARCGLHVHVDRTFFAGQEDSCIAKIIFLMMKYRSEFMRFSRRKDSQLEWCEMFEDDTNIPLLVKEGCDGCRYMALNLTNYDTIEFRLWRGTLRYKTFIATLKFTNRICNLVKDTGVVELNKMTWDDILGDDEDIKAYWATRNS